MRILVTEQCSSYLYTRCSMSGNTVINGVVGPVGHVSTLEPSGFFRMAHWNTSALSRVSVEHRTLKVGGKHWNSAMIRIAPINDTSS